MKLFNKEFTFNILPKVNLLLILGVIVLTIYLCLNLLRPYQPFAFDKGRFKNGSGLVNEESSMPFKNLPVFDEGIFKERALFSPLLEKKPQQEEATFELLGLISIGEKNAAMIRNLKENKDYYCLGGEAIGDFKVREVFKDRVILESEGKILEIRR